MAIPQNTGLNFNTLRTENGTPNTTELPTSLPDIASSEHEQHTHNTPETPAPETPDRLPKRKPAPVKRAGTPRGRVTEKDSKLLAFIGQFPAADPVSLSLIEYRDESRFAKGGELPSLGRTTNRLRKLQNLGAIEKHRHAVTGDMLYGLTPLGYTYATDLGHDMDGWTRLEGLSLERLNHYRMIARVSALLVSPAGYYETELGTQPYALEDLVSEKRMRQEFDPIKKHLAAQHKQGQNGDFGRWRIQELNGALERIQAGRLHWDDLVEAYPALLTIGQPQREETNTKPVHQPDLAVIPKGRTTAHNRNLLVEVELTKKSWNAYDAILATLAAEFKQPYIYSKAVYFTTHSGVQNLLKRVDEAGGYGLFESGKLTVLPILDREGNQMRASRRVVIGK